MSTVTEYKIGICVEFKTDPKTGKEYNNNKFWEYTLYDDGTAMTAWGRVDVTRTEKTVNHAKALQKWREKTNIKNKIAKPDKYYTEVDALNTGGSSSSSAKVVKNSSLKDVAKKQIIHSNPHVQKLIDHLVDVNIHTIMKQSKGGVTFDASTAQFKTPLGVIAPDSVNEARDILVDIADFVANQDFTNKKFMSTLNKYLRIIPHGVGMAKITPKLIFPNHQSVIAENDLLDGLAASFIDVTTKPAKKTSKKKDTAPKVFDVELTLVEDKKTTSDIRNLYQKTRKSMHQSNSLSVHRIFSVEIKSMKKAFDAYGAKMKDVRRLWHGTKASNLLSILRGGLIIPPSSSGHCTGRMYGDGIYASSVSTKALNYATNFWGSGGSTDRTFMFLLDMAMGTYYDADTWGGSFPKVGTDSTWARAGRALKNDEMIVYRLNQVNLVYLIEFRDRY